MNPTHQAIEAVWRRESARIVARLASLVRDVWPLFAAGRLSPQLEKIFPISQAEAAFAELASNQVSGKLVLVIDHELK